MIQWTSTKRLKIADTHLGPGSYGEPVFPENPDNGGHFDTSWT